MSRLWWPLCQIGIVVRDIESAMNHWDEVRRVGPWTMTRLINARWRAI
jgi:hypothetical protein